MEMHVLKGLTGQVSIQIVKEGTVKLEIHKRRIFLFSPQVFPITALTLRFVCAWRMPGAFRLVLDALELGLQMVVAHHVGTGNQTQVLWKSKSVLFTTEPPFLTSKIQLFKTQQVMKERAKSGIRREREGEKRKRKQTLFIIK